MSYYDAVVMVTVFCSLIMLFQTYRTTVLDQKTRRSFRCAFAMLVVIIYVSAMYEMKNARKANKPFADPTT